MKTIDLKAGMKIEFTLTNRVFTLSKVTDKRVSWYVSQEYKSSWGKNTMKMVWISIQAMQRGLENGTYIIK